MPKVERQVARNQVLARLNDADRKKFYELEKLLENPKDDDLTWHRDVGKFISDSGIDEKVPLSLLSYACGLSDNTLGRKVRLCKDFKAEEVVRLQKWQIPLGVVIASAIVRDSKDRWDVLLQAKDNHWTEPELRAHLKATFPSPHPHGGRPRKKPKSFSDQVDVEVLIRESRRWLEYYEAVWQEMRVPRKLKISMTKASAAMKRLVDAAENQRRQSAEPG